MKVSVVIPCRNEERYIEHCLLSLLQNGYDPERLEILVVDGMSTDRTKQIVEQLQVHFPQIKWMENPKRFTPFALNIGVFAATGEAILISGAHASFSKGYIETLCNNLVQLPNAVAVGGVMQTEVKNSNKASEAIKIVLSHRFGVGNATFRTGTSEVTKVDTVPFGLYRAAELKQAGGYDERLIRNHDMELSKRLLRNGQHIYLIPDAQCTYYARERFGEMAANNFRNGKWNMLTVYITRNFRSLSIRHFIPLLFVLSIFLPVILSIFWWPFIYVSLLSIFLYFLAILYFAFQTKRTNTTLIHVLCAFGLLHISYGMGSIIGIILLPAVKRS